MKESISHKSRMSVRSPAEGGGGFIKEVPVPGTMQESSCITRDQVIMLARYALEIEKHYGMPMDIEWALDAEDNRLYIVQARPETVWSQKEEAKAEAPR
ncbi:MAG: PEP/pyruvate-binding domain-containing protein [Candidatus Methanomethylicaceae archaeon]